MIDSQMQSSQGLHNSTRGCSRVWPVLIILTAFVLATPLCGFSQQYNPNKNRLAIKKRATIDSLGVQLQPLTVLNFKTKSELFELRNRATARHSELLVGNYQPSEAVFGQIADKAPWWGILGAYYYDSGKRSITGPSLQSRSILNPYLLVAPQLNIHWDETTVQEIFSEKRYRSFSCPPQSLRWYPIVGRAEVTYDAQCLEKNQVRSFSLIAYNARDFNLNYIYVSYPESSNVFKNHEPSTAYQIPHYLHQGGSCGYPGGCNNWSPHAPPLEDIQIVGWPCKVVVYLWERDPGSVDKPADMQFDINIE